MERMKIGETRLNEDTMDLYMVETSLPENTKKLEVCADHIAEGAMDELMSDFWIGGCDFDAGRRDSEITIGLSCAGQSLFRKKCRLTLRQFDPDGTVLNTGTFE